MREQIHKHCIHCSLASFVAYCWSCRLLLALAETVDMTNAWLTYCFLLPCPTSMRVRSAL